MAQYYVNKLGGINPPYVKVQGTLAWVWQPEGDGEPAWTNNVPYEKGDLDQYRLLVTGSDDDFKQWLRDEDRREQEKINRSRIT